MTLTIIPEVGLTEVWAWQTDVIRTWNGNESRLSLRSRPRIQQAPQFNAVTQEERRELVLLLAAELRTPGTQPLWAWSSRLSSTQTSGNNLISADTRYMSLGVGDAVVLLNLRTRQEFSSTVSAVTDTTFTMADNLTSDVDTNWFAFKAMTTLIENNPRIGFDTVTGRVQATLDSWIEPTVQRTGASSSLTTLGTLPILELTVLEGAQETPELPRTVLDLGGRRSIGSRENNMRINRRVSFVVDRSSVAAIDYARLFLDTVRGSQKAFLLPTQLSDLTLNGALPQNGTTFTVNEVQADTLLVDFATYQNIRINYEDGTHSDHQITDFTSGGVVTISPATPNDPKVASVRSISYLLKTRMADRLEWRHGDINSTLSFNLVSTNSG